jgi:hypothetical protein
MSGLDKERTSVKYQRLANSWGVSQGEDRFFKVRRGKDAYQGLEAVQQLSGNHILEAAQQLGGQFLGRTNAQG